MTALLLSVLPLILLIFVMVSPWPARWLPLPATTALPAVALLTYGLQWLYFRAGHPPGSAPLAGDGPAIHHWIHAAVIDGLLSAFTPLAIVFGALLLFKTLEHSGAMAVLTGWLRRLTPDPVAQCMLLGWAFSYLVEGLSGFGTPAALAAPVLAGLLGRGYPLVRVAALCLVMNSVPVSFGAVGTPTWFGLGGLGLARETLDQIGRYSAVIHGVAAPVIVLLALRIVLPWAVIRSGLSFVLAVVAATMSVSITTAWFSAEFPSILGGLSGLVVATLLARSGWGLAAEGKVTGEPEPPAVQADSAVPPPPSLLLAAFPILGVITLLAVTRIGALGLKGLLNLETPAASADLGLVGTAWISPALVVGLREILGTDMGWKMALLYVPFIIPFVVISLISIPLLRMDGGQVRRAWGESLDRLRNPAIAMAGALVLVKLMMLGNLLSPAMILGRNLGEATGQSWPWFAALLGALGAFFSGSNTVSNLTFAPIQMAIADTQNLSVALILALQSVGGAMGNMICIHNIVAVAAILGLHERGTPRKVKDGKPNAAGEEGEAGAAMPQEAEDDSHVGGVADVLRLTFGPMVVYAVLAAAVGALIRTIGM